MRQLFTLAKKDLLEITRTRRLHIIGFIFLFAAISSPILAKLIPEIFKNLATPGLTITIPTPTYKDAIDQYIKNLSQIVLFVMIFVLAGAISDEKSKRYLEILISKPVSRGNYIFAKFVTYLGVTKIVFILASLIFAVYTYSLFGSYPIVNFIIVAVLVLIYILLILSATLSISAMVSNSFLAAGGAIFFFFLINIFSALFEKFNIYNPVYILGNYQSILKNGWNNDFLPSSIVSIILIFVFIFIAIISFQRQEID